MTYIKMSEFWQAASNWQDVSWNEKAFGDFTGLSPNRHGGMGHEFWLKVTDETARRIELLLGPHSRTVIKAYLARGTEDAV